MNELLDFSPVVSNTHSSIHTIVIAATNDHLRTIATAWQWGAKIIIHTIRNDTTSCTVFPITMIITTVIVIFSATNHTELLTLNGNESKRSIALFAPPFYIKRKVSYFHENMAHILQ